MITIIDVIRALSGVLESVTGSAPTTKDVTEGFERPCTYLRPLAMEPEEAHGLQRDYLEMEIVYFASRSRQGWQELLDVQTALAAALTMPVEVTPTFFIYPEELEFVPRREDMSLTCTFSLENYQLLPGADGTQETMEILVQNGTDQYQEEE